MHVRVCKCAVCVRVLYVRAHRPTLSACASACACACACVCTPGAGKPLVTCRKLNLSGLSRVLSVERPGRRLEVEHAQRSRGIIDGSREAL